MKAKVTLLLVVAAAVCTAAARSPDAIHGFATGELHWTRISVCEHPSHPGLFLQYYLTDGCGQELFLHGDLSSDAVGCTIWAEGTLVDAGFCQILDISQLRICGAADPNAAAGD